MTQKNIGDLAVFGGVPTFDAVRHVNTPNAPERGAFQALFDTAFDSHWFTNDGPLVRRLEAELSAYLGVPHCVAVANGTVGMELLVRCLGLQGEVIVPSFTFISTPHVLHLAGIRPRFCDISRDDMMLGAEAVAALITDKTSAVIPTHMWGHVCDTERLGALCADAGVKLIYDAAHGFGCAQGGQKIGSFGDAEVFSLHATKALHALEGGVITTHDATLAAALRQMRNFGFIGVDKVAGIGINAKMSEAHGAMGLANLAQFDAITAASKACWMAYRDALAGIDGLVLHDQPASDVTNYHYVVGLVDDQAFGMHRDTLVDVLFRENIWARRYYAPGAHRSAPYCSGDFGFQRALPVTEDTCERVLVLPGGAMMTPADAQRVGEVIRFIAENAGAIAARINVMTNSN